MLKKLTRRIRKQLAARAAPPAAATERLIFEPVEPRILLSADLPVIAPAELVDVPVDVLILTQEEVAELQGEQAPVSEQPAPAAPQTAAPVSDAVSDAMPADRAPAPESAPAPAPVTTLTPEQLATFQALQGRHLIIVDAAVAGGAELAQQLADTIESSKKTAGGSVYGDTAVDQAPQIATAPPTTEIATNGAEAEPEPEQETFLPEMVSSGAENLQQTAQTPVEIRWLDADRDGIQQVGEILDQFEDLASVHLLTHGAAGLLRLGNTQLDSQRMKHERDRIAAWGKALRADGDLLLYGCEVADGEAGVAFVDRLAALTGADVAASSDDTGSSELGGDWEMEYTTGAVASAPLIAASSLDYQGLLGTIYAKVTSAGTTQSQAYSSNSDLGTVSALDLRNTSGTPSYSDNLTLTFQKGGTLVVSDGSTKLSMKLTPTADIILGFGVSKVLFQKGATFGGSIDFQYAADNSLLSYTSNTANPSTLLASGESKTVKITAGSGAGNYTVRANGVAYGISGFKASHQLIGGKGGDNITGNILPERIDGGKGADLIQGSGGADTIYGGSGNDELQGGSDSDTLDGDAGNDLLQGQAGADTLYGDSGDDTLEGGADGDTLNGAAGDDLLDGGSGNDQLIGGGGDDRYLLQDGWGADSLTEASGGGSDTVDASAVTADLQLALGASASLQTSDGANTLAGINQVEGFFLGKGTNSVSVTQGFVDSYAFSSGAFNTPLIVTNQQPQVGDPSPAAILDLSAVTSAMRITIEPYGTNGNRVTIAFSDSSGTLANLRAKKIQVTNVGSIIGGAAADTFVIKPDAVLPGLLDGGAGDNRLEYLRNDVDASSGKVLIDLSAGNTLPGLPAGFANFSSLVTGDEENRIVGNGGDNVLRGEGGNDEIIGAAGADIIDGGAGDDQLQGDAGDDLLVGGTGNDTLTGGTDNDTLVGKRGADTLVGGAGNDTLQGGWGADTYQFTDGWGQDTIETDRTEKRSDTIDLAQVGAALTYSLAGGEILIGDGTFTRNSSSFGWSKASGSFDPAANTIQVNKPALSSVAIQTIKTGEGKQTIYFGNEWKSLTLDTSATLEWNGQLVLDFSGASTALRFDFKEDGSLVVSKIGGLNALSDNAPGLTPDSITITGVDANTTIISGRYQNTYRIHQATDFKGTLELTGGRQYKQVPTQESALPSGIYVDHTLDLSRFGLLGTSSTLLNLGPNLTQVGGDPYSIVKSPALAMPGIANLVQGDFPTSSNGKITNIKYGAGANVLMGDAAPNEFSSTALRPGVSLMSGLIGADTYSFSNLWGMAVIGEMPDVAVTVDGTSYTAPEALDTLDFSSMVGNIEVDIYQYSAGDAFAKIIDAIGGTDLAGTLDSYSGPDVTSNYIVVRDTTLGEVLSWTGVTAPEFAGAPIPASLAVAMDIESIIGPSLGTMKVNFHGDASLRGTLEAGKFGDIILDYSDYGKDESGNPIQPGGTQLSASVDLNAGLDLPGLSDLAGLVMGDTPHVSGALSESLSEFLNDRHTNWGRASGVEGNRLGGLTTLLDLAGPYNPAADLLADYGVKGVSKIIGSDFDDTITADNTRITIVGSGGNDAVIGVSRDGQDSSRDTLDLTPVVGGTHTLNNIEQVVLGKDNSVVGAGGNEVYVADVGTDWGTLGTIATGGGTDRLYLRGSIDTSKLAITRSGGNTVVSYDGRFITIDDETIEIRTDGISLAGIDPLADDLSADSLVSAGSASGLAISEVAATQIEAALDAYVGKSLDDKAITWDNSGNNKVLQWDGSDLLAASDITVVVADLLDRQLSSQQGDGTITIDATAAGFGWGSGPDEMDLQSALVYEIGLKLGVDVSNGSPLAAGDTLAPEDPLTTGDHEITAPLLADGLPAGAIADVTNTAVTDLLDAARQAWVGSWLEVSGNSTAGGQLLTLADIPSPTLQLQDLPGNELARTTEAGVILLDPTAADHGWFLDATLETSDDLAAGRIDLYSVLVHEIGHALGMGHSDSGDVMDGSLALASRPSVPASPIRVVTMDSSDQSKLKDGLDAFSGWVGELGDRIDGFLDSGIPFTGSNLAHLLPISASNLTAELQTLIGNVAGKFGSSDINNSAIAGIDGIELAPSSNGKAFSASLPIKSVSQTIGLDFGGLNLDFQSIPGLENFDFGLQGDVTLDLEAALKLDFEFGIDPKGNFYVDSPAALLDFSLVNPDLDLELNLGPFGLRVTDGSVDIGTAMSFGIGGRISYQELVDGRFSPAGLLPTLTDTRFDVDLPLALTGALAGLQTNDAAIQAHLDDVPRLGSIAQLFDSVTIETQGLDGLFEFNGLSIEMVINGLISVLDGLVDENSALFTDLPGIDQSLADLLGDGTLDLLAGMKSRLEAVRDDPNASLGALEDDLNSAFNDFLGSGADPFSLTYEDSRLGLDFSFEKWFSDASYDFSLDLGDYASQIPLPPGIGADVSLGDKEGDVSLGLLASSALDIGMMWDLSDLTQAPQPEVAGDSGIRFDLDAGFENPVDIDIGLDLGSLGTVSFLIDDATADIGMHGFFGLDGVEDAYGLGELGDHLDLALEGSAALDLPMFFPDPGTPLGSQADSNGDGIADNVLHFGADFDLGDGVAWQMAVPDLENMFSLSALLNDPQRVLQGLEAMFDTLAGGMQSRFAALDLPLVGDAIQDAGDFVGTLRDALLGDKSGSTYLNGLGKTLQEGGQAGKSTIDLIREALYAAFGPSGLNLDLQRLLVDDSGRPIRDATGDLVYADITSASEIGLTVSAEAVGFNLILAGDVFDTRTVPLTFGAALPGFNLETEGGLDISMDYVFGLGFGLSASDGVYLDTSGATDSGAEFALNLDAQLQSGTSFETTLGFLRAQLIDADDDDGASGLFGEFEVDLTDGDGNGRFGLGDSLGLEARLSAYANADLYAALDMPVSNGLEFPQIDTTIHYDQQFAEASFGTGGSSASFGGTPALVFEDVTLDAGSFISGFMGPVVDQVNQIIEPVRPVIELLQREIGFLKQLGSPATTLLELAKLTLGNTKYKPMVQFIDAVIKLDAFIQAIADMPDGGLFINFGTFDINTADPDNPEAGSARQGTAGSLDSASSSRTSGSSGTGGSGGSSTGTGSGSSGSGSGSTQQRDKAKGLRDNFLVGEGGFSFPLLTNPTDAVKLLLGRDVDLFLYDMPDLTLLFDYSKSFPIFPGLNARIGGLVKAEAFFAFGFDTTGVRAFMEGGFGDPTLIFNGFFVDDQVVDSSGNRAGIYRQSQLDNGSVVDQPEVVLTAGIKAGASVGVGGLVEAGVEGGIQTVVNFDLNDIANEGTGRGTLVEAQYDNKLRVDEILTRLDQSPLCLFDMHGVVRAFLEAFFWVGVDTGLFGTITIFEARKRFVDEILADFSHDCPDPAADIAQLNNGTLTLKYIPDSSVSDEQVGERAMRYKVDVVHVENPTSGAPRDVLRVTSRGVSEDFELSQVSRIITAGTDHADEFFIGEAVTENLDLSTGKGDDIIRVLANSAGQTRIIRGGDDDDTIETADGADTVYGGSGNDIIITGGGADAIWADDGLDQVDAGDGDDQIHGGGHRDYILAGKGNDNVWGDGGQDRIEGGDGNDVLHGGDDADTLLGQDGLDRLYGEVGADVLVGGAGVDSVYGGSGNDNIQWTQGDGSDAVVQGGTDTSGSEQDSFEAYALTSRDADSGTLGASGLDVVFGFNGANMTLEQFERVFVDLKEGGDSLAVQDLSGTSVSQVDVDFGTGEILDTALITQDGVFEDFGNLDAAGLPAVLTVTTPRVFRASEPYDTATGQARSQQFYRQVAKDGSDGDDVAYQILSDGDLDLVQVTHSTLGSIYVQRRDGADPSNEADYDFEAFETRTEQRSHREVTEAFDANGKRLGLEEFIAPRYGLDSQQDRLHLFGSSGEDEFQVSTTDSAVLISQRDGVAFSISNSNRLHDELQISTQGGADRLDASQVGNDLLKRIVFEGGAGEDTLAGSPFVDHLDGGADDDTVTGGRGVDTFANSGGGSDTLVEIRDANFELSDSLFKVDELNRGINIGSVDEPVIQRGVWLSESEDVTGIFSEFILTATDVDGEAVPDSAGTFSVNHFFIHDFTANAILDGSQAGDSYDIQLSSTSGGEFDSFIDVRDTGNTGFDSLLVRGTNEDDVFHFDKQIVERLTPRPGDQGADSIFAPVTDYGTEVIVRDTSTANVSKQTVNYLTAELFTTHGRGGDDLFLVDDSSTELEVYGDSGDDRFFIGNVLETQVVNDPKFGNITAVKRITNGVSYPGHFYGGTGDDYFEVNHNIAEIFLYGQEDDDIFYIKALLTTPNLNPDNLPPDDEVNVISEEGGEDKLVYVKNAPVNIFGGAGFDTVVVVGTEISDTFYVFTERVNGKEVQRIYGAGLNIPTIEGVERLQLLTGGGDDVVYFYGSLDGQEIIIDTGAGDDTVYVGGPARDFDVEIPEFKRTQVKRIPQPDLVEFQQVMVRPAYSWYEQKFRWSIPYLGIKHFPYWVRHDEPAQYRTIEVRTPQPDLVVPVVVTQPESIVPIHMPSSRGLDAIQGPIIFRDGSTQDGTDRLIIDNTEGVASTSDEGLYRQQVRTIKVSTDNDALVGAIPAWMGTAEVGKALANLINSRSAIVEPELADALAALQGSETRQVVIPEGYRIGAEAAGNDTRDVDTDMAEVKVDPDTGEILIYATRDITIDVPEGFVTGVDVKQVKTYDVAGRLGSASGLFYSGFSDIELQLAQGQDDFTVQQTADRAITRVFGNGGDDIFRVKATTGPLHLYGDTADSYYESLERHLPELGQLLGLQDGTGDPRSFDPDNLDDVAALMDGLNREQGLDLDIASLQSRPALDAEDYNAHIMSQVRFNVNRLGDSGAWSSEPALVGQWLDLGHDFDQQSAADKRALVDRFNGLADAADRIPVGISDDELDSYLSGRNDLIWGMLKDEYNTLDGSEHYADYPADVRQVLGLDHDFDPADPADLEALVAMLNDRYNLGINPDQAEPRPFFERSGESGRFTLGDFQPEVWRLLVDNGLASAPSGSEQFLVHSDGQRVDPIAGPLFLHGQAGADHALVDDRANRVESEAFLTQTTLTGLHLLNAITFGGLESMDVHTGSARDQFNVQGVLPNTRLFLHDGDDRLYASSLASLGTGQDTDFLRGDLDAFAGNLDIDFGAGRHKMMVSDEAASVGDANGVISNSAITGLSQGDIRYGTDGNLADGIWIWTSQGADQLQVVSTHRTDGVRTTTSVNTGRGDDVVGVDLQQGSDGYFVSHLGEGDDQLDGSSSSLDLQVFGGLGNDRISGGSGNDHLFGDAGLLEYGSEPVEAHFGNAGPGDFTDGRLLEPRKASTATERAGGNDRLSGGAGDDALFGGDGSDELIGGDGDDALLGDFGAVRVQGPGMQIEATPLFRGGDDTLRGGAGHDVMMGGYGHDTFFGSLDEDVMQGEYARITLLHGRVDTVVSTASGLLDLTGATQGGLYDPVPLSPTLPPIGGLMPLGADFLARQRAELSRADAKDERPSRKASMLPEAGSLSAGDLGDWLGELPPAAAGPDVGVVVDESEPVCRPADEAPDRLPAAQVALPSCDAMGGTEGSADAGEEATAPDRVAAALPEAAGALAVLAGVGSFSPRSSEQRDWRQRTGRAVERLQRQRLRRWSGDRLN